MSQRWEPWDPSRPPRLTRRDWIRGFGEFLVLVAVVVAFALATLLANAKAS